MNLSIRHEQEKDVNVLYLAGEVDTYTAPTLREMIIPLAEQPGQKITVDLSDIDYIDSTGLGVFIGALKATHAHKGTLTLTGVSARVQRLFTITGLDELITINRSVEEELK